MRTARDRMLRGQADANDSQPYRCVKCGEAVSIIRHSPCACTRAIQARTDLDARGAEIHRQRMEARESSACVKENWCVLQVGHAEKCSATMMSVEP